VKLLKGVPLPSEEQETLATTGRFTTSRWVLGYRAGIESGFRMGYEVARADPEAVAITMHEGPLAGLWLVDDEGRIQKAK
jgi:hypothetical protein